MRIAIIGAGATGLPTARIALEYGNEPVVFEKSTQIGGLWKFRYEETEGSILKFNTLKMFICIRKLCHENDSD